MCGARCESSHRRESRGDGCSPLEWGAYDHVHRSAMMAKLRDTPSLRGLLPFVRSVYSRPSCYKWKDSARICHDIHQREGGEQGDPLMPLLFSLAIHDALVRVSFFLRSWMTCMWSLIQAGLEWCTICWLKHFMNMPELS